jgi:cell division protease FtsH
LGREIGRNQNYSEETSRKIDAEVTRIINEQHVRGIEIISARRGTLDKIAEALLEHETIEGKHVMELLEFGEIRSAIVRVEPPALPTRTDDKEPRKPFEKPATDSIGGSPAPSPA